MEDCKCQQMQAILKSAPRPNVNPPQTSSAHYRTAVITNSPQRRIPQRKADTLLIVPVAESANDFYNEPRERKKRETPVNPYSDHTGTSKHQRSLVVHQGAIGAALFVLFSVGCGRIRAPCCSTSRRFSLNARIPLFPLAHQPAKGGRKKNIYGFAIKNRQSC